MFAAVAVGSGAIAVAAGAADQLRPGLSDLPANPEALLLPGQELFFDPSADAAPPEPAAPVFDIELDLGLRGSFETSEGETRQEFLIVPEASFSRDGSQYQLAMEAVAEIARGEEDAVELRALRLSVASDFALNRDTDLSGAAEFALAQNGPLDLEAGIAQAPQSLYGALDGTVTRRFGKLEATVRGSAERALYGEGESESGEVIEGSLDNVTTLSGGLRLGLALSPVITVFGDASLEHDDYDRASEALLVELDGDTYALRAGFSGNWREVVLAEASIGIGQRHFADESLQPVTTTLYDASVTYRFDETTALTASVGTEIAPPSAATAEESTRIAYSADLDFTRAVNSWLALRASAAWSLETVEGEPSDQEAGFGVGADYRFNQHAGVSADYGFTRTESPDEPPEEAHRVTVGLQLSN